MRRHIFQYNYFGTVQINNKKIAKIMMLRGSLCFKINLAIFKRTW